MTTCTKPRGESRVKVWLRIRPTANFANDIINLRHDKKIIDIHLNRMHKTSAVNNQIMDWSFQLDGLMHNCSQEEVYQMVCHNIVTDTLRGFNGTLMCYGQTGAGKTFTMTGATESYQHRGIIPRALSHLYSEISKMSGYAVTVRVSYLEIYNETMSDLLATLPESNHCKTAMLNVVEGGENGAYVKGLSRHLANNEEEALNFLFEGETNRAIAAHVLNKQSSRSHCIFTVYIEIHSRQQSEAKYTMSKLNFVDLAGSERLSKTGVNYSTENMKEAMYINKSLSFLEQTVIALADGDREYVPYRQTKLTHCLKDSIGGNCNTLLIANIWGEKQQIEETISTLRFATRMMCVRLKPAINEKSDPVGHVQELEEQVCLLKRELAMYNTLNNKSKVIYEPLSEQQLYEIRQQVNQYIEGSIDEIDITNVIQIRGVYSAFRDACKEIGTECEEKLRQRYTFLDRTDSVAIAAAQSAGLPVNDEGDLVGEPDTTGFSVGLVPSTMINAKAATSSVVNTKKKEAKKGKKTDRSSPSIKMTSPSHSVKGAPAAAAGPVAPPEPEPSPPEEKHVEKVDETPAPMISASAATAAPPPVQRPSTPPMRSEAFEDFKKELGSEMQRILMENKDILNRKVANYVQLAHQLNTTKADIDSSVSKLQQLRAERESEDPVISGNELIISQDEFAEINNLKQLKMNYREMFEKVRVLRAEMQYCEKLVEQSRNKLIQEFENWYNESFMPAPDTSTHFSLDPTIVTEDKPADTNRIMIDEEEKFEQQQMKLLLQNPESMPFYNAKTRLERRKVFTHAMAQPQPSFQKRSATPTRSVRNAPPTTLQIQ